MEKRSAWLKLTVFSAGLIGLLWGCGRPEGAHLSGDNEAAMRRAYWQENAPTCAGFPAKADCVDGDMVLFGGLLCASGEERGCALVRESQDSDGRWWRSPRRNPGNMGKDHSFSRDMAMGVLLYLTTTRDTGAAQRWLAWMEDNRACAVSKPWGGGCLVRGPHRFCRDDSSQSCTLTPGNWALLGRVWMNLGLELSQDMRNASGLDSEAMWLEAEHAPLGYETHLPAVEVLLKQRLDADGKARDKAARTLAERQPQNPFFVYLRDGATPQVRQLLWSLCPDPARGFAGRDQWAWERDSASEPWRDSMGWDCLFLANLTGL